eukprot:c21863_g1_i1 orf=357-1793(+)
MHEKVTPGTKPDPSVKVKESQMKEGKISNAPHGPSAIGAKSASFRQSKSFNIKESMLPKSHGSSKTPESKSNGALSKQEARLSAENGGKFSKSNGATKSGDPVLPQAKPKPSNNDKADVHPSSRSEKVKSPGILKNSSSSKVNVDSHKKNITEASPKKPSYQVDKGASSKVNKMKETSPMANVRSLSLSLNADPEKKLPPIKTVRVGGSAKSVSAKNTANLCAECKAELEGAVCFIGNDGRVSACTSRTAVRLCKNLKCANNNSEYVASLAAAISAPKKYLVSRRHSLNLPRSSLPSSKSSKAVSDQLHTQSVNENGSTESQSNGDLGAMPHLDGDHEQEEFYTQGELEDDVTSLEDIGEVVEIDGIVSASPHRGRLNGHHRMRRRSFSVIETQGPEVMVTLKKQMMQERKQAEEWMLDYAIEEALHKLAPSSDSKVKALVEAFESVIPHKDSDVAAAAAAQEQPEGLKTPVKISVKI